MTSVESLQSKYPGAMVWSFGDDAGMANDLADLVIKGKKKASCGSLGSYLAENPAIKLVKMSRASRILEIGTLGGWSDLIDDVILPI
ncbi:ASCH domain-containing protein [Erwinia typographi]|uniref:hypothetical protein n=1 Tax=Erwinia typographi TaxID=371042 RepID=UPI00068F41AE|nr:hypothetical protein [Erwinia typographi]